MIPWADPLYAFSDIVLAWVTGTLWGLALGVVIGWCIHGWKVEVSQTEWSQTQTGEEM